MKTIGMATVARIYNIAAPQHHRRLAPIRNRSGQCRLALTKSHFKSRWRVCISPSKLSEPQSGVCGPTLRDARHQLEIDVRVSVVMRLATTMIDRDIWTNPVTDAVFRVAIWILPNW